MTDVNSALAEAYLRMLNEHDPNLVEQFVAADYANHNPFVADGREANRAFWGEFFTALPDLEATMEDLVATGDRVVGRFSYGGTHRGEFFGIPASGRHIEMRSIDIWRVADGAFVEHWDELNTLDLMRQFGLIALLRAAIAFPLRRLRTHPPPPARRNEGELS